MSCNSSSFAESSSLEPESRHQKFCELQTQKVSHLDTSLLSLSESVKQRLEIMTRVADILGIDDVSFASYSAAITRLSSEKLSIKRSLNQLEFVEGELRSHLASAKHEERLSRIWTESMRSERQTETANLEGRRETLLKKAKEYRKQLEVLMAEMPEDDPTVTVTDITKQQEANRKKEQELKEKRTKIKAFQGLPPNLELARHELRNAQSELTKLLHLRERLLGRMADGVA